MSILNFFRRIFGSQSTEEIERKFLVDTTSYYDKWVPKSDPIRIVQGYLSSDKERTVRIRIAGNKGFITIKGMQKGISCPEFEYAIPVLDAFKLIDLCEHPLLTKDRYVEHRDGFIWEIDVFHGDNEGLVIAEIELSDPDEKIVTPGWIGQEVSTDPKYKNVNLIGNPYKNWKNT